jgi:hypothetical protein
LHSLVIVQPIPTRVRAAALGATDRMWVKARAVLVIETVSIAVQGSNIRATDRAPNFLSNRRALA